MPVTSMWSSTPWRSKPLTVALAWALVLGLGGPAHQAWANTPATLTTPTTPTASEATLRNPARASTASDSHPLWPGSRLQGEATLRFWGLRIYHARLWTRPDFRAEPQAAPLADQALLLELQYLRDLQGPAIAERSLQEMRRSPDFPEAQATRWLATLQRLLPDVRAGDRLSGQYLPGQGLQFWHNDRLLGRVDDLDLARRFMGIWLAPTTSEPAMRLALLGLGGQDKR